MPSVYRELPIVGMLPARDSWSGRNGNRNNSNNRGWDYPATLLNEHKFNAGDGNAARYTTSSPQGLICCRDLAGVSMSSIQKPSSPHSALQIDSSRGWVARAALGSWLFVVLAGVGALTAYSNAPGPRVSVLDEWPRDTQLTHSTHKQTLVMFLHPHCPCSRSALRQLEQMTAHVAKPVAIKFVFYKPAQQSDNWAQTDMWDSANLLSPGNILVDCDGQEAKRFHATTSGHVVVFDQDGRCSFSGGITAGRGHEGDSPAYTAAIDLLNGRDVQNRHYPTYGCTIYPGGNL